MKKIYSSLFVLFAALSISNAQNLLIEEFNYNAGDSLNQHGWITSSGGATNRILVTSPGLTYTGYPLTAGNAATLTTSGQDVYKLLNTNVSSGSVYTAFLFNVINARNSGDHFISLGNATSSTSFTARLYVKNSGTGFVVGLSKGSEGAVYDESNVLTFGTTYLAVTKYTFNPSTDDDVASLYFINGALPATEPSAPTLVNSATSGDLATAARIFLRQGTATSAANVIVDGIKVSTEWSQLLTAPVSMTAFNLEKLQNAVKLTWRSAQEKNAKEYIVERSADNENWQKLATVPAVGNTSNPTDYSYTDSSPLHKTNFYRLKIVDMDGSFEYYKTLSVNMQAGIAINAYPNPVKDILYVQTAENKNDLQVDVYNVAGSRVMATRLTGNSLNVSRLQAGVYFVKVTKADGASTTLKIVKL